MEYNIFFSWQSEKQTVSDFVREQLDECCKRLSAKHQVELNLKDADADNRGSYNINTAVINGIENADIVVADLTPTSHGNDGRANPNANALYEYAYACSLKGFEDVVAIADISEDSTRNMPFDCNHNSLVTMNGIKDKHFGEQLEKTIEKILLSKLKPVLHSATTTFFAKRISESFPGIRGLKEYSDQHEIKKHLDALFKHPLVFSEATDGDGDPEPIWWFRGGSSEAIDSYRVLKNGIYLFGRNEFKIKRIIVFECHQRYYSEYVYVETESLPAAVNKSLTQERISQIKADFGHCDEEYGVVKSGNFEVNISGEEFDDGYADMNGEIVEIRDNAERRCRWLAPFNFVVCAKFSSINCDRFDLESHPIFEGILNGSRNFQELHELITTLPKPEYRGR